MDQKRELSSIDLAALVTELNRYEGAKVDKAYLYDDDLLRLKLRDFDRGRVELMIEVGDIKRAHVADPRTSPTPRSAAELREDAAKSDVRRRLRGRRAVRFDRILTFEFEREDENTTLVAELFGQGNVARSTRPERSSVAPDRPAQVRTDGRARRAIRVPRFAAQPPTT